MFKIEIYMRKSFENSRGAHVLSDILKLGVRSVTKVDYSSVYIIDGDLNYLDVKKIASELLSDKITESYTINSCSSLLSLADASSCVPSSTAPAIVEVWYKKGVTDTVAESVVKAIKDLCIVKDVKVKAGHKYYINGMFSRVILNTIVTKLLVNTLVQEYDIKWKT